MAASRIRPGLILLAGSLAVAAATASAGETVELKYKQKFMVVTEKGVIVSQNLKGVVFKREGAAEGETVAIPWQDVRAVDGRPAEQAFADLKERLAAMACPDCRGKGNFGKCMRCGGAGKEYTAMMTCPLCKGSGMSPCTLCRKGGITCPGKCLKRSSGGWNKDPKTGGLYRTFTFINAGGRRVSVNVSTAHEGEVIEIRDGALKRVTCLLCGGKTTVPCKTCEGTAKRECTSCRGDLEVPDPKSGEDCDVCVAGTVQCKKCGGTGLLGGDSKEAAGDAPAAPARDPKEAEADPNAIRLKDGRVIRGKVMMRTDKTVVIKTENGKIISIDKDQIQPAP